MIAIAYTLSFCFLGAQMIRWLMPRKSPLVRAWLGVSLGMLMEMGLPALCANALDLPSPRISRPSPRRCCWRRFVMPRGKKRRSAG